MADAKFLEWETKRFQRMMKAAQSWSGHGAISDIWLDEKPISPKKTTPSSKKSSTTLAKGRSTKLSSQSPGKLAEESPGGSQNSLKRLLV